MNMPLVNPRADLSVQEADLMINRNLEGTISMLESRGFTSDNQMQILIQKQITKTILKMFLGAIQEDADDRGYQICQLLETPQQVILFSKKLNLNFMKRDVKNRSLIKNRNLRSIIEIRISKFKRRKFEVRLSIIGRKF